MEGISILKDICIHVEKASTNEKKLMQIIAASRITATSVGQIISFTAAFIQRNHMKIISAFTDSVCNDDVCRRKQTRGSFLRKPNIVLCLGAAGSLS